jgi:uncharacterized protein
MTATRLDATLRTVAITVLLLAGTFVPHVALAQPPVDPKQLAETKAHYTKYEYRIPMRDGVKLFTAVYVPKDQSKKSPILLTRTPYSVSPYGPDQYRSMLGPSLAFDKAGYIFALQDVRGCNMSEGQFVNVRPYIEQKKTAQQIDESSDTYDTIDWLIKHVANHNGKVGMTGISYPGFYTAAGMIDAHPALKAASPQAPVTDWFVGDDFHHNGAFYLGDSVHFLSIFDKPHPKPVKPPTMKYDPVAPDVYAYYLKLGPLSTVSDRLFKGQTAFLKEMTAHGTYDEYWKARNILPHLKHIKPAVLTVGGWFDAEDLFGPLQVYAHIAKDSPETNNRLVMGPWIHGGWARGEGSNLGDVPFNAKTSEFFREQIELPFFEYHLKGKGSLDQRKAWVFETGTNVWRKYADWPPKHAKAKSFYLQASGKLTETPSPAADKSSESDAYVSDPAHPVPFIDGTVNSVAREYMTADQRFASRRSDVLVYEGPVLEEDLSIAGPIKAHLTVSTSGTDSDWIVKLIDVYPDDYPDPKPNPRDVSMGGYQQLVRAEVMRGKFRNSFEKPEPFKPNEPTTVNLTLNDVCHNFRSGHRVMVQVQSSWFPLIDRNPQVFLDIYAAKDSDYHTATERVYHSRERQSSVTLLVMP